MYLLAFHATLSHLELALTFMVVIIPAILITAYLSYLITKSPRDDNGRDL